MSFYTFAAANLTTADDRKRCPIVNKGQVVRTIVFCLTLAAVLIVVAQRQGHAAESGFRGFVEELWSQARNRGVGRESFDRTFAGLSVRGTLA